MKLAAKDGRHVVLNLIKAILRIHTKRMFPWHVCRDLI